MKLSNFAVFCFLIVSINIYATDEDSTKNGNHFELSFGQSMLFVSQSQLYNIRNKEKLIIPTNAILFFSEINPRNKVSFPIFLNIATETKQFQINDTIYSEKASPTLGFGITYKPFQINISNETKIDFEIGPSASIVFDKLNNIRVAPIIAARFRITRGKYFSMYFGSSYSIGIGAFGILYGTGSLF